MGVGTGGGAVLSQREGMAWVARKRVALERQSGWYTLRQRNSRVLTRLRLQRNRT
jgi:hypothetical protein